MTKIMIIKMITIYDKDTVMLIIMIMIVTENAV